MSLRLRPFARLSPAELNRLQEGMTAFYRQPPPAYYQTADRAAAQYSREQQPFHCDLVERVQPGASVLELGCGTAHFCPHAQARGGTYTGMDHSEALLAENRLRFPQARFLLVGNSAPGMFDLVVSLYTIEHIVDPPAYLEQMWNCCKPGGLLGVICPEFIDSPALPPSLFYGRTPRRLRAKLRSGSLIDVISHVWEVEVEAPRWQARAQRQRPGAFWINLRPRILHGAPYDIDADAVHLARSVDLVHFFESKGASILCRARELPGVSPDILKYNTYVVARKPGTAA